MTSLALPLRPTGNRDFTVGLFQSIDGGIEDSIFLWGSLNAEC